jgi:formylglycine-generating enzyme required for sulfatase activity
MMAVTMPMELQIIRAQEFTRLGAHGQFDLEASKAVLAELAGACWKRGINQALLDVRALHPGSKPVFSPNDLVTLVNTFREIGFTRRQRLAVLYRSDPHHRAPLFTFIAKQRGWNVQAFRSFEDAFIWLSHAQEPQAEIEYTPRAKKVPVRKLKDLKAASMAKPAFPPTVQLKSKMAPSVTQLKAGKKHAPSARTTMTVVAMALMAAMARQITEAQPVPMNVAAPANAPALTNAALSAFAPTISNPTKPPGPAPEGMVWIPGGEFSMGCVTPSEGICTMATMNSVNDAQPVHRVYVDGFWMDTNDVTNEKFEKFVKATGYRTIAEIAPTKEQFPTAPPENLVAGSTVFTPTTNAVPLNDYFQWWRYVHGADWRHPTGPDSDLKGRENYPVVQIAYADAVAYAKWAGKRLPTEAEWEFAGRGGLSGKTYFWGDKLTPGGRWMANIYTGQFPVMDTGEDGYAGIAPVGQFPPNGYGLFDMAGNVWQWCSDWYRPDTYARLKLAGVVVARNPQGPAASYSPGDSQPQRVQQGGSFLCTDQYCTRYMMGTRGKGDVDTGSNHLGFRCVKDVEVAQK